MAAIQETIWGNTTSQDIVLHLPGATLMVPKDSMRAIASEFDPDVTAQAPQLERMGEQSRPSEKLTDEEKRKSCEVFLSKDRP